MNVRFDQNYITADNVLISAIHGQRTVNVPSKINGMDVTRIGNGAYKGLGNTGMVNVGEGIREISHKVFENCQSLLYVYLPESLETIEDDAFAGTSLKEIAFWLTIPYKKYISVREGSIRLTDGRYIFDPKTLGERASKLIKSFMPESVTGRFRPDPRMGYLYAEAHNGAHNVFAFEDYCSERGLTVSDLENEKEAIKYKIACGDADRWFDIDEETDDLNERNYYRDLNIALLFCIKEGAISDSGIKLKFVLSKNRYYFQRGIKVMWNGCDYYYVCNEYLTNDDKNPFCREISHIGAVDSKGNRWSGPEGLEHKYLLFQGLI